MVAEWLNGRTAWIAIRGEWCRGAFVVTGANCQFLYQGLTHADRVLIACSGAAAEVLLHGGSTTNPPCLDQLRRRVSAVDLQVAGGTVRNEDLQQAVAVVASLRSLVERRAREEVWDFLSSHSE